MSLELDRHFDHDIVIAKYSDEHGPVNYAVECITCYEVIIDDEAFDQLIVGPIE